MRKACERDHGIDLDTWLEQQRLTGWTELKLVRYQLAIRHRSWRAIEWLSRQWLGETTKTTLDVQQNLRFCGDSLSIDWYKSPGFPSQPSRYAGGMTVPQNL